MNKREKVILLVVIVVVVIVAIVLALFGSEEITPDSEVTELPLAAQSEQTIENDIAAYDLTSDLVYATDSQRQILNLYLPEGERKPVPVIVWVHGGAWVTGNNSPVPAGLLDFTEDGYAIAAINYRFATTDTYPAQVEDVQLALAWLKDNAAQYNLDTERFGLVGHSAGAQMAMVAALSADEATYGNASVAAVVGVAGPYDILKFEDHATQLGIELPEQLISINQETVEQQLFSCDSSCPERFATLNPLTYASRDDPPVFLQHGSADTVVPYLQSQTLNEALNTQGVTATYEKIEGSTHDFEVGETMRSFILSNV